MENAAFTLSPESSARRSPPGILPGHGKFAFVYGVVGVGTLVATAAFAALADLSWLQGLLIFIGCLSVGWAILFTILEVRRLAQSAREREEEALLSSSNPYVSHSVAIDPSTGDPYPHHEDYGESCGQDQGQRTSRLPGTTPLIDRLVKRAREN
jgi:hypothetical protein